MYRWENGFLWVIVIALAFNFGRFCVSVAMYPSNGYAAYYTAARLVVEGADAARFYDDDWFREQIAAHGPPVNDIYFVNPPTMSLILLPLAGLDFSRARVAWTALSVAWLAAAVALMLGALRLHGGWAPGFVALVLLYQPVYANMAQGQVYTLLLLLLVVAWIGYRQLSPLSLASYSIFGDEGRVQTIWSRGFSRFFAVNEVCVTAQDPPKGSTPISPIDLTKPYSALAGSEIIRLKPRLQFLPALLTGVGLGLAVVLKTAGAWLLLLLLVQRQWRALGWTVAVGLWTALLLLPWLTVSAWWTYLGLLPGLGRMPEAAVTAYQTQLSLTRHLFSYDAQWNPAPLVDAPALASALFWLSAAVMVGVSGWLAVTRQAPDLQFATFTILSVVLSPVSQDYHYTLLLLPMAILVTWVGLGPRRRMMNVNQNVTVPLLALDSHIQRSESGGYGYPPRAMYRYIGKSISFASLPALILVIAIVLLMTPLPTVFDEGTWALLAYPKLYGAWGLWGLAVWAQWRLGADRGKG